jgi:hypothetical protein
MLGVCGGADAGPPVDPTVEGWAAELGPELPLLLPTWVVTEEEELAPSPALEGQCIDQLCLNIHINLVSAYKSFIEIHAGQLLCKHISSHTHGISPYIVYVNGFTVLITV